MNELPPKEISCGCGHQLLMQKRFDWCINCGKRVYYHSRDRRWGKLRHYYVLTLILAIFGFLTYVFIELLVKVAI